MKTYKSNGKLLLTGEYVVLDGALALAIPTKYGQSLEIESINESKLIWNSLDEKGNIWFEDEFVIDAITNPQTQTNKLSERLIQILNVAKKLNPDFLSDKTGFKVATKLDFPKSWGLGTSSTLINNIAQWANIDAYKLLEHTFGGSGYDIACAQYNQPITYQIITNKVSENQENLLKQQKDSRIIKQVHFNPSFKNHLYFVYLNQKQNSREGIAQYKKYVSSLSETVLRINTITQKIINSETLDDFMVLIEAHENIISKIIKQEPVKERLFSDFNGSIKSLGAWGGDFVLVAAKTNPKRYFYDKGYHTVIPFKNMIL